MRFNICLQIVVLFILLATLFTHQNVVMGDLSTDQVDALNQIATSFGYSWSPNASCGATGNRNSIIVCDSNQVNVTRLILNPSTNNNAPNVFDKLPALEFLQFSSGTIDTTTLTTLITHPTIQKFYSYATKTILGDDWTGMTSLSTFFIQAASQKLPKLLPGACEIFYFNKVSTDNWISINFPINQFTPKLTQFTLSGVVVVNPPVLNTSYPLLEMAPNLENYVSQTLGYQLDLAIFYNVPPKLKVLSVNAAAPINRTFPAMSEIPNWLQLNTLRLNNLQLSGVFPTQLFAAPNLTSIVMNTSPNLQVTLTEDIGNSKLATLSMDSTNVTGTVPSNILDGKITNLILSNTNLGGALPGAFLCCASANLEKDNVLPTYLFDNNDFNNYWGPSNRGPCSPQINSISPNPIPSNSTKITIYGQDLGDTYVIQFTNSMGELASVGCSDVESKYNRLVCTNPLIQGYGSVLYRVVNGQMPYPNTTSSFIYAQPSITDITRASTLGGQVTVTGYDLFDVVNENSVVVIYGQQCTNIKVIQQFTKFECTVASGITSNVPVIVSNRDLTNDPSSSIKFFYNAPTLLSATAAKPNVQSHFTIYGADFWNDQSIVDVKIDNGMINCTIQEIFHYYLICSIPPTPYSSGLKSIQINVNGQLSVSQKLFSFSNPSVCPSNCNGKGECDIGLGTCVCDSDTNISPSCSGSTMELVPSTHNSSADIFINNGNMNFQIYLISVIENGAETIVPLNAWVPLSHNDSYSVYNWVLGGKQINVTINYNNQSSNATVSPMTISGSSVGYTYQIPANSYSFHVDYRSISQVSQLQFRLAIVSSPEECDQLPIQFAQDQSGNIHWFTLTKNDIQYYARLPTLSIVNGATVSPLSISESSVTGLQSTLLINVNPNPAVSIRRSSFQFEFSLLQNSQERTFDTVNNCPVPEDTSSKKKIIAGAVVGSVVGAALLGLAAFVIIKQQMKIRRTHALLDKKLSQLKIGDN